MSYFDLRISSFVSDISMQFRGAKKWTLKKWTGFDIMFSIILISLKPYKKNWNTYNATE